MKSRPIPYGCLSAWKASSTRGTTFTRDLLLMVVCNKVKIQVVRIRLSYLASWSQQVYCSCRNEVEKEPKVFGAGPQDFTQCAIIRQLYPFCVLSTFWANVSSFVFSFGLLYMCPLHYPFFLMSFSGHCPPPCSCWRVSERPDCSNVRHGGTCKRWLICIIRMLFLYVHTVLLFLECIRCAVCHRDTNGLTEAHAYHCTDPNQRYLVLMGWFWCTCSLMWLKACLSPKW